MKWLGRAFDISAIGACVALPLLAIAYLETNPFAAKARTYEAARAQLRCLKGLCFVMSQESLYIDPIPSLESREAFVGDRVLTLDENSELEITFPDASKLILRNTSLLTIQKGRGTLLREIEKGFQGSEGGADAADENKKQKAQSIIYVGNLPVEVLYPAPNSEIIPDSFPTQIRVTFRVAEQISSSDTSQKNFQNWTLYSLDENFTPTPVENVVFDRDVLDNHFTLQLGIARTGTYLLAPTGLDAGLSYNGFRFSVFDKSQLDQKIQDLLDNYESSKDKPLEIRQK